MPLYNEIVNFVVFIGVLFVENVQRSFVVIFSQDDGDVKSGALGRGALWPGAVADILLFAATIL